MFLLRIQCAELAPAFTAADDVGTSSSAADDVGTSSSAASNPISPRLSNPFPSTTSATTHLELPGVTSAEAARNPRIRHTSGVLHLYRSSPASSYASAIAATPSSSTASSPLTKTLPRCRGTRLLVLAVPTRITTEQFVRSCPAVDIHFIRSDWVKDRYSVVLEFQDQKSADIFYLDHNGSRFMSSEVCYVVFVDDMKYTSASEIAVIPPDQYVELPTCPVCITRLGQRRTGIGAAKCDHSYNCSCFSMWICSSCPVCKLCQKQPEAPLNSQCSICQTKENLWICLICGSVGCGRYKEGHALQHWKNTRHCSSLDLETERVWDYIDDSFVKEVKFKSKSEYSEETCVKCYCSGELNYKYLARKQDERLLFVNKLASQRNYYQARLSKARKEREQRISAIIEKAVNDKSQELQVKLATVNLEKNKVSQTNQKLTKLEDTWRRTLREIEEREKSELKLKDDRILDLQEQVRDFKYNLKVLDAIKKNPCADEIKGGMMVPLATKSDSTEVKRSGRRRKK